MRSICFYFLLCICAGCKLENNKSENIIDTAITSWNDTPEKIVQPKIVNEPELLNSEIGIRKEINRINNTSLAIENFKFPCDEETSVTYYREANKIKKIKIDYNWVGDSHSIVEFYYSGNKLIFIYNFLEGGPACEGCIVEYEYRSYISGDRVIKYYKDKELEKCRKCVYSLKSKEYRLLTAKNAEEIRSIVCYQNP